MHKSYTYSLIEIESVARVCNFYYGIVVFQNRGIYNVFVVVLFFFFFFQAEDGIRDYKVTGVQTCALPISCVTVFETLAVLLPSPPYSAVIEWLPTLNAEVLKLATPLVRATVSKTLAPPLNVTLPLGTSPPGGAVETAAGKVTDWPNTDGLELLANATLVANGFTVSCAVPLTPPRVAVMVTGPPTTTGLASPLFAPTVAIV